MPGMAEVVQTLQRDGVTVKILTGDSELVARHVCAQVGLDVGQMALAGIGSPVKASAIMIPMMTTFTVSPTMVEMTWRLPE